MFRNAFRILHAKPASPALGALLGCALLTGLASRARAQASPGCQVLPKTLAAMRGCYRPLLVFTPGGTDPRLRKQISLLDNDADDMMDRFVLFTPVLPRPGKAPAPLDAPHTSLTGRETAAARARYHVGEGDFAVLLLGEDGSVKLRSKAPVAPERLNELIDRMPTRKEEMRRPHANQGLTWRH